MSFSQYSGCSARLTRTRPTSANLPRPKSVTSQRGCGGNVHRAASKQRRASASAWLISDRFMTPAFHQPIGHSLVRPEHLVSCGLEFCFLHVDGPGFHLEKRFTILDSDRAVAGRGGEEAAEIARDGWFNVQDAVDGVVTRAAEALKEPIARHCARVPVAAFVFVERVARASVEAVAGGTDNFQSLIHHAHQHEMRGGLVFDARPDFVRIDEREGRFAA